MSKLILLDGAMGTMLQNAGLAPGGRPEIFGLEHPDILEEIQRKYVEAGSDVIYANTFGANAHKLKGTGHSVQEVVSANVATARRAAGYREESADADTKESAGQETTLQPEQAQSTRKRVRVALDVGPIGELMEPMGTMSFEDAYETYREMAVTGEQAGADLIVFETMTDLYEVKAAVLAARENTKLPIWVTMSFEAGGRTFTGTLVSAMAATLDGLGVDAMGINCSLGPQEIFPMIEEMKKWTDKPLIVKPNAGLPDPFTGGYNIDAEEFVRQMRPYLSLSVSMVGGCCGTTPEFIAGLAGLATEAESEREAGERTNLQKADTGFNGNIGGEASQASIDKNAKGLTYKSENTDGKGCHPTRLRGVCSSRKMVDFGGVRVIGERINPTGKKRFAQALREHDIDYIVEQAIDQADAGADILDINVGLPGIDEAELMTEVVQEVQSIVSLPLQIDSSDPAAIEAGLRACSGRAIVNSVNAEDEVLEQILPIVKKYGAAVVGLTMDKSGIPDSAEERFRLAEKIVNAAVAIGIPREDVLIDCLTLTISAQQEQAVETLKAVRMVHEKLGLHCVLGVSNISFGLPKRIQITTNFLTQALCCGLDFPIVNPNQKEVMDTIAAFRALSGEDAQCEAYIERFADEPDEKKRVDPSELTVEDAVLSGLKQETRDLTAQLLESMSELDVINTKLIPALDVVGDRYEKEQIFLPQLINSANAACAGFDLIKERIAKRGGESVSKGTIIMATVEGDIHDIGKNIVRVVLENYGYRVIDLGRDVPPQKVVDTAVAEDVKLVGLSALMTTTVVSMKKTIEVLHASRHDCKVFVGGAVLTPEYAMEIGADYYTKDAKASVDVAREVLG
ncbi:MAG: homocysteine S-methyltransferase family protein [Clostridiales bacterium]|nr:homocysteine S-methyltransferase family protein [Clostridiales bacterium]